MMLSITSLDTKCCYSQCFADCRACFIVTLNVVILKVVTLSDIVQSVGTPSVVRLSVVAPERGAIKGNA
jgi:hypothetical protein